MLTLVPSSAPFVRIRAGGRLDAADYRRFEREFVAQLERRTRPFPLLLDLRGFRGWTPAGLFRDLRWDLANRASFSRIAVIGDKGWHRWITIAGAPLFRAPMRFFGSSDDREAEEWLLE